MRLLALLSWFMMAFPLSAHAQEFLPDGIGKVAKTSLTKVGSGRYRKLGFTVYHATLWAPEGQWDIHKPYALQLRYAMDLSQATLTDAVMDSIREEKPIDETTLTRWHSMLVSTLPAVNKNDELVGLSLPGKDSRLFFNGSEIARIQEREFSDAFFGIWFGDHADETLKARLLGQAD